MIIFFLESFLINHVVKKIDTQKIKQQLNDDILFKILITL
jgi:hypothetical protein